MTRPRATWRRRLVRGAIVAAPALVVVAISCTDGAAPAVRRRLGNPNAAICTSTITDAGAGSGSGSDCKGLDIFETTISLVPAATGSAHVDSIAGFVDTMVMATITGGGGFSFQPPCSPLVCDFGAMPVALPYPLGILCDATDGQPHMATLSAFGAQGPSDVDTAVLSCGSAGSGALIDVAPSMIDAGDVRVGTASLPQAFTVTNNGTAPLMFSATLPTDWTAPGSPCIAPAQCPVAPGGGAAAVGVEFTPPSFGSAVGTISISSNAGARSITVTGNGLGSYLMLNEPLPPTPSIDFGTIPRDSMSTRPITVSATGNLQVSVNSALTTTLPSPFSIAPPQLALDPGMPQQYMASCGSAMPTGPKDATVDLTSTDAYGSALPPIALHCEVANTQVSVAPNQFDFGEVRKGTHASPLAFTISNQGQGPVTITAITLAGAPAPLSMSLDDGSFPHTLGVGEQLHGQLSLTTDDDLDLAASAPKLQISVDGERLVYPVTGKVTTPAAYVTPEKLELGTICIGSDASAVVSLVNSGTASLMMQPPQIEPMFALQPQSPPRYPAPLLAGTTAALGIAPAVEMPGQLSGKLSWTVDAPKSPFEVPIKLAFIETGTAISPASLSFSTVKVGELSLRYPVKLQNCSTSPVMVTVDGIIATRGGTAAWKVDPSQDARTLAPQDRLTVSVAFAPLRRGHHVAQLKLGVDGETRFVLLDGDGIDLDAKLTSFYACGCNTPDARTGGPIALAIALAVLRRRRPRR